MIFFRQSFAARQGLVAAKREFIATNEKRDGNSFTFRSSALVAKRGFTLMELLIVISIIGILASIILPQVNNAREKGQIAKAKSELKNIQTAMALLYDDTGVFPNGESSECRNSPPSGNEVDLNTDAAGLKANGSGWFGWNGPYYQEAVDPWGTPYYLDEDYQCLASTTGCRGVTDSGNDSSVIVSCGPNAAIDTDACAYDEDNIVLKLCS